MADLFNKLSMTKNINPIQRKKIQSKPHCVMKSLFLFILISAYSMADSYSQSQWTSPNYGYTIEVPKDFEQTNAVGQNVDFKAVKGKSSIVVIVNTLPVEYAAYNIWEILGDLETFGGEWQSGAREYMNNPQFLKYGKTKIDGQDTFWYDYTTDSPKMYSKTYQAQKGRIVYTFTLTSPSEDYNMDSPVWFRFKNNIEL